MLPSLTRLPESVISDQYDHDMDVDIGKSWGEAFESMVNKGEWQTHVWNAKVAWIKDKDHPQEGISLTYNTRIFGEWYRTKDEGHMVDGHKQVREIHLIPGNDGTENEAYAATFKLFDIPGSPLTTLYLPVQFVNKSYVAKSLVYGYDEDKLDIAAPDKLGLAPLQYTLRDAIDKLFDAANKCPYKLFSPGTYDKHFRENWKDRCQIKK